MSVSTRVCVCARYHNEQDNPGVVLPLLRTLMVWMLWSKDDVTHLQPVPDGWLKGTGDGDGQRPRRKTQESWAQKGGNLLTAGAGVVNQSSARSTSSQGGRERGEIIVSYSRAGNVPLRDACSCRNVLMKSWQMMRTVWRSAAAIGSSSLNISA